MELISVIMAGGSGKRFWPLSRETKAKQSLALFSDKTLLAETIERISPLSGEIVVVSSFKQKEAIEADALLYKSVKTLYEPSGRNTAPCIMLAIHSIKSRRCDDCAVLVLPADHHITENEIFRKNVKQAVDFLEKNRDFIGTIGIEPKFPETGFGYIQKADLIGENLFAVKSFEEKPPLEKAQAFLKSGNYLWNGGIFLFSLNAMLDEFKILVPDIYDAISTLGSFEPQKMESYNAIRSISFDYAIMERTQRPIFTVSGDFEWSDAGNWSAYYELLPKDCDGNAKRGSCYFIDCKNSLALNLTDKTLFLFNKFSELIVATQDVVFSASLRDSQAIRRVAEFIKNSKLDKFL